MLASLCPTLKAAGSNPFNDKYFLPLANEVCGKVIFSVVCVKNSVHKGGYLGRYTPWAGTVPGQIPPQQVHPPRQVHPPGAVHAGRYGQQVGGTHPTGMHSCSH